MKKEVCCGAVVFNGNNVLLIHQVNEVVGFPKGHVEEGETYIETAIREVKEETNIDIEIIDDNPVIITYSPKENVIKDVYYYKAKYKSGQIIMQEKEIASAFWTNKDNVLELLSFDNLKEVWQKINKD